MIKESMQVTQYTHEYRRSEHCQNFIDANGVERKGNCSHIAQYELPHCSRCGHNAQHSQHQISDPTIKE